MGTRTTTDIPYELYTPLTNLTYDLPPATYDLLPTFTITASATIIRPAFGPRRVRSYIGGCSGVSKSIVPCARAAPGAKVVERCLAFRIGVKPQDGPSVGHPGASWGYLGTSWFHFQSS